MQLTSQVGVWGLSVGDLRGGHEGGLSAGILLVGQGDIGGALIISATRTLVRQTWIQIFTLKLTDRLVLNKLVHLSKP